MLNMLLLLDLINLLAQGLIRNLTKNNDFNAISKRANKNKEKIEKLQTFDLDHFFRKFFLWYFLSFFFGVLYTAFLHNIKCFGYKVGIQFNKCILIVKQNNLVTKIVNPYIACNLDNWPRNSLNNFALKYRSFGATK